VRRFTLIPYRTLSAIVLASALAACRPTPYEWHGTVYEPARVAPPITLPATDGTTFDIGASDGRLRLVYFGYIHCPDICPATLSNIAWVYGELGPEADRVQTVFVTVDPDRDSLPALADYLGSFSERFLGLRGERGDLLPILDAYGVYAGLDASSTSHEIEHSARLFLVDTQGTLRAHYPWDVPRQDLLTDLKYLLDEGA
jgi:protein SCO1